MVAYLLWAHGEDGPEDLVATLDRKGIKPLLLALNYGGWFEKVGELDMVGKVERLLEDKGDIPAIYPLMSGWGGLHLQVVELDAIPS